MLEPGLLRSGKRLNQEMLFAELKLIRPLLISRSKRRDILLLSFSLKTPRIFLLVLLLLFLSKMRKISLHLLITRVKMLDQQLLLQLQLPLNQSLLPQLPLLQLQLEEDQLQLSHQVEEFSLVH